MTWPLALGALALAMMAGLGLEPARWHWQAGLWLAEPWRLWTCALVHGSALHAAGNALGVLLLAALGWRARLGPRELLALALAWPLGHALLALKPDLPAYFGASGVLHAATVLVALGLWRQTGRARAVGALVAAGLLLKLLLEQPWGPALRWEAFWGGMPIAPFAHASGALAGLVCGVGARLLGRPTQGAPSPRISGPEP